jgi:flavin reductase (DIM6/NTAB) family NADH-FMN oxidoreductase RutF
VPLIAEALVTFECEAHARYDGGDHEIFVGKVVHLHRNKAHHDRPLVFAGGRYRHLDKTVHKPPAGVGDLHGWVADLGGW